jgi:hypothetical protein
MDSNIELTQPFSPQTIEEWREIKITQLYAEQKSRLDGFLLLGDGQTQRSQGETLTWSAKAEQAKKFIESGDLADCPMLVTETVAYLKKDDGEPTAKEIDEGVKQLAKHLINKQPILEDASAQIVGSSRRIEAAIRACTTIEELQQLDLAQGWV